MRFRSPVRLIATACALTLALGAPAQAKLYRVASTAPGMSPFVVNTAVAKLVSRRLPEMDLQVRATGAATQHYVEAAQGKVDFLFGSPTINWLMDNNLGPFKDMPEAPALEDRIGAVFSYQIGPYHYVASGASGIETLEDIKGRTVFAGPPGGAATGVVIGVIKQLTGYEPGVDYDLVQFGFDAAAQAFQDDKIDVIVLATNIPSPTIEQFALTKDIRLLDIDTDKLTLAADGSGTVNEIAPDAYGDNQLNAAPIRTHGAIVNFSASMETPGDVVYALTKTIWENQDELNEAARWMKNAVTRETALDGIPNRLHPGAERYYREVGMEIKPFLVYGAQ